MSCHGNQKEYLGYRLKEFQAHLEKSLMKIMELKLLKIVVYLFVESSHTLSVTLFLLITKKFYILYDTYVTSWFIV